MTFDTSPTFWCTLDDPLLQGCSNELVVASNSVQKSNAIWLEGPGLSTRNCSPQFYVLNVVECASSSSIWFGLSDSSHFGSGWKLKGLMCGRNLSDGSSLLQSNYCPEIKSGDSIGMRLSIEEGNLCMYYSFNGTGLGKAFELDLTDIDFGYESLFPVVSFSSGPAKVTITRNSVPEINYFQMVSSLKRDSFAGDWCISGNEFVSSPTPLPKVIINVDTDSWTLTAQVVNGIVAELEAESPHVCYASHSTKLLAPSHLLDLEEAITAAISSIQNIELVSQHLIISCKQKKILKCFFHNEPVHIEEISWLRFLN